MTAPMTMTISSASGDFTYVLSKIFADRHVAENPSAARTKAQSLYDPFHENQHAVAVTVIVRSSLAQVQHGVEIRKQHGYHWSLGIDGVQAVTMGPSGRFGGNGDLGQLDDHVDSVVLSGYTDDTDQNKRIISHIAASQ